MKKRVGLFVALLIVAAQWLFVRSFVSHSYTLWLKVDDAQVTASFINAVLLSIGSACAVAFALWSHDQFLKEASRMRFGAQLVAVAGLAGLLVFWGMIGLGYIMVVNR